MKNRKMCLISLAGLTASWLILRWPLFFLHGMREWPFVLFVSGILVAAVSGLVFEKKILPVFTLAGYDLGFFLGYCFQRDYGPGLNSLWIIWSCVYLGVVLAGAAAEFLAGK